jgi:tRNA dimethylallyltransferase
MPDNPPIALCLMGPTASGKTSLALALHEVLPVDIISVDSSQVYRGMDIGTAKPTPAELMRAPHRLIDIRDPSEPYSASEFCTDAQREMESITRSGRIPLFVGGAMFYFHTLEFGLSQLPPANLEVRRRLTQEAARHGWPVLYQRLQALDPETAALIKPNDAQRVQRALEIYELAGLPPSEMNRVVARPRSQYRFIKIALWPRERGQLHARIAQRFRHMLERGFIQEVENLYRRGDLSPELPSVRTVGYRQVWEYLTKSINYNEMVDKALAATRQLAKRQITWLRRYPDLRYINNSQNLNSRKCVESFVDLIESRSENGGLGL